jgi:hypothetical protein
MYLYKDKDVRHSSIEITIYWRCIPMWKARWTLNSQLSERGEVLPRWLHPRGCIVRIILSSPRIKHIVSCHLGRKFVVDPSQSGVFGSVGPGR